MQLLQLLARRGSTKLPFTLARTSTSKPRMKAGQPPMLPQVSKEDIPRLFSVSSIDDLTYRASYHGEESKLGNNVYGGLLCAQALAAAQLQAGSNARPSSLHTYFVAFPYDQHPIDYKLLKLREGKQLASYQIQGVQGDDVVVAALANFVKSTETTIEHTTPMPTVKQPDECIDYYEFCEQQLADVAAGKVELSKFAEANMRRRLHDKPYSVIDIRPLNPKRQFLMESFTNEKPLRYWIKASIKLNDDPLLHAQFICYLSDQFLASAVAYPHLSHRNPTKLFTSLDNTLTWHSYDYRADEWLLYEVRSAVANSGRGFATGRIYTRSGQLIVSTAQEVLARFAKSTKL